MQSSKRTSFYSLLSEGLKAVGDLSEEARVADESIMRYLRQRSSEVFAREYRKRFEADPEETQAKEWAAKVAGNPRLTAPQFYAFFEFYLEGELDDFWDEFPFPLEKPPESSTGDIQGIIESFKGLAKRKHERSGGPT
jgi:hypothetical protein